MTATAGQGAWRMARIGAEADSFFPSQGALQDCGWTITTRGESSPRKTIPVNPQIPWLRGAPPRSSGGKCVVMPGKPCQGVGPGMRPVVELSTACSLRMEDPTRSTPDLPSELSVIAANLISKVSAYGNGPTRLLTTRSTATR